MNKNPFEVLPQNPCSVMTMLIMLSLLIDQVQQLCYKIYQKARKHSEQLTTLSQRIRALIIGLGNFRCWQHWYTFLVTQHLELLHQKEAVVSLFNMRVIKAPLSRFLFVLISNLIKMNTGVLLLKRCA